MKRIKYIILSLTLLISFSCKDFVEGINVSPNSATDAPLEALITASQVYMMGVFESEDARLATMWAQQFTGSDRQYASYNVYGGITSEVFTFFNVYVGIIQPTLDAQNKADAIDNQVAVGMLKVMRAIAFGHMASLYGDIPFTEANQYPEIENPVYDSQVSVYAGVQALLSDGIADLSSGNGGIPSTSDIFYGGDVAAWIEAAHSAKARFFLHTGEYSNAISEAGNGISTAANDMLATHGTVTSANQNSWYDFHQIQRSGYLTANSAHLPTMLDNSHANYRGNAKTDESDRFNFVYTGATGTYDLNVSALGMFAVDADFPLFSYNETQLIIAEANMRIATPDPNAALDALNNVRAQLAAQFTGGTYDPYVIADFDPAGIANTGQASSNAALLDEIVEERYCTLVGQIEVFTDMRRLDNPLGLSPTNGTQLPQRFLYPTDEVNSNANVPDPLPGLYDPTPVNQ